ncbi:uncharacterized protein LOC116060782 [Sander lucioperca]|uniref:uncharacterized protein LOC116060782 n=1 Tax=Sander lucioperca TaxID=283035 RepID=UPI0016536582|nr:uncharacterized protein LOC116060782 [Sander lucioperca]XP_031170385.2 uncharacterized protein LOC116060782 [Sander lucioperca]
MLELNSEHATVLMDEILHSIFFLGKINDPQHPPESIVTDAEMLDGLKSIYPRPFDHYSSQLPKRSPFSCVLDMIVLLTGQEKEEEIKRKVREITEQLIRGKERPLSSSTICVSQIPNSDLNSHRYYGVSMSTAGRIPGRIMVAASCLSFWDKYVAGAVMTYYPNKAKKRYFDGTIKLPENVRCKAFKIVQGTPLHHCRSCKNLFFKTNERYEWAYGNCAEVESLSNLFKNVEEVREQAKPTSVNSTEENRKKAEESVKKELRRLLKQKKFKWDGEFFTPQHPQQNVKK